MERQNKLNSVSYTLYRHDTLVTGHVRTITGKATIVRNKKDSLFGFRWIASDDTTSTQVIYDGTKVVVLDHSKKEYSSSKPPASKYILLGMPAGRIVFPDILQMDTSQVIDVVVKEDTQHYFLLFTLRDITSEDVTNRYKRYTVNKRTLLPTAMTFHQETLGKVQDLSFRLNDIHENLQDESFGSLNNIVPANYSAKKHSNERASKIHLGQSAPQFELPLLTGGSVSSQGFPSKLVLLDFWELWCGPCLQALPKMESLQSKYGSRGLVVIAITSDSSAYEASKLYMQRKQYNFLTARGDESTKSNFDIQAFPTYVLIDKENNIVYYGNTDDIESEIEKKL